jgi:hypothetical protein
MLAILVSIHGYLHEQIAVVNIKHPHIRIPHILALLAKHSSQKYPYYNASIAASISAGHFVPCLAAINDM